MQVSKLQVPLTLMPFVNAAFSVRYTNDRFSSRIVPRVFPALLFNFSDSQVFYYRLKHQQNEFQPGQIYFGGVGCSQLELEFRNGISCIIVLINPYCTGWILEGDVRRFAETYACISDRSTELILLNNRLNNQETVQEKWLLITDFLKKRIQFVCPNLYVKNTIEQLIATDGLLSVSAAASNSCTCTRNLRTLFGQHVGISPKKLSQAVRFNRFLQLITIDRKLTISEAALQCEYYDLSHLNKDFQRFTGLNPERYLEQDQTFNLILMGTWPGRNR